MPARHFPPPWSVAEQPACFVVRDHNGQKLAYVYFEDKPECRFDFAARAPGVSAGVIAAAERAGVGLPSSD
jgi:hypothetical protein